MFLHNVYKPVVSTLPANLCFIACWPLGPKVNVDIKFMIIGALNSSAVVSKHFLMRNDPELP